MIQFGPGDYSMSIGVPGQFNHPRVREAEKYVIETALAAGVQPRAEISEPEQAERYLEMGVRHFNIGSDMSILYRWFCANGKAMSELLGTTSTESQEAQEYPA
jgi:4-hydroxy-2-oxoheptanedioate aldolase